MTTRTDNPSYPRHTYTMNSITLIPRQPVQAIVLASVGKGTHIQVGAPANREGAHALHTILDEEVTGYYRDERGRLRHDPKRAKPHYIGGRKVNFYRVREGSHEFGNIETVPVGRIARRAPKGA